MKQNGLFFLDILSIVPPKGTRCFIQAPGIEGLSTVLSKTDDPAIMVMDCNKSTIEILKNKIIYSNIQDNIMYISIKNNDITLFEGYDGVEYGIFSKNVIIPQWFRNKYKPNGWYEISDDW